MKKIRGKIFPVGEDNEVINPILFASLIGLSLTAISAVLVLAHISETVLFFFVIPVILAAMWYPKRYYLALMAMVTLAALVVVHFNSDSPRDSLLTVSGSAVSTTVLAEVVFRLTQSRRKVEAALRANEQQARLIAESMSDMVARTDSAGNFEYVSLSYRRALGYEPEELVGKSLFDLVHPDDVPSLQVAFERASQSFFGDVPEFRFRHADGHFIWVEASGSFLRDAEGNPAGAVFSTRDVSERRSATENLQQANEKLTLWVNELEQRTREATLLSEMGELLQSCLTSKDAFGVVIQYAARLFPGQHGALYMYADSQGSDDRRLLEAVGFFPSTLSPKPALFPAVLGEPVFLPDECWALRRMRTHVVASRSDGLRCAHAEIPEDSGNGRPYFCVPITAQGETLGLLHIQVETAPQVERWRQLAVTVGDLIALTLANLRLREDLRVQAILDPVTNLYNRRYMEKALEVEVQRAINGNLPFSLIMLDIDHFKNFNDNYSYAAGDALLREMGFVLRSSVRADEVACRYGGEEFILILPGISLEAAVERAERLRETVRKMRVQLEGTSLGEVTISLGVASLPQHGLNTESLLRAVDTALHEAKYKGRNRVAVAA